jgi:hypothetical protein
MLWMESFLLIDNEPGAVDGVGVKNVSFLLITKLF